MGMGKDGARKLDGKPRGIYAFAISANEKAKLAFMESCGEGTPI
jgi:hypothetical protein